MPLSIRVYCVCVFEQSNSKTSVQTVTKVFRKINMMKVSGLPNLGTSNTEIDKMTDRDKLLALQPTGCPIFGKYCHLLAKPYNCYINA